MIRVSRRATLRDKLETARALESLPEIAAVAYEGDLSREQLSSVTKLADENSAMGNGPGGRRRVAPVELARLARNAVKPSTEDSRVAVRGEFVADVVDAGQGDVAAARAVARCDGRDVRGDDPEADRADEAGEGSGVGQLRTSGRRRAGQPVRAARHGRTRRRRWRPGRSCSSTCPRTAGRRSPGYRSPTHCSNSCGPTRSIEPVLVPGAPRRGVARLASAAGRGDVVELGAERVGVGDRQLAGEVLAHVRGGPTVDERRGRRGAA